MQMDLKCAIQAIQRYFNFGQAASTPEVYLATSTSGTFMRLTTLPPEFEFPGEGIVGMFLNETFSQQIEGTIE